MAHAAVDQCFASPNFWIVFFSRTLLLIQSVFILLGLTLLLLLLSPLYLYKWLLSRCFTIFRPDLSHIVAPQSAIFLAQSLSSSQPGIWNIVVRFKVRGMPDIGALRVIFHEKFVLAKNERTGGLCYPELQQFCVRWGGYYFWKQEEKFRIEDHVVFIHADHAPRSELEIDELEQVYLHKPIDAGTSPWKIQVVENMTSNELEEPWFLVLFKFHHSLADGMSMFQAFAKCFDEPIIKEVTNRRVLMSAVSPYLKSWKMLALPFQAAYEQAKLMKLKSIRPPWEDWGSAFRETATGVSPNDLTSIKPEDRRYHYISRSNAFKVSTIKAIASKNSVSFTAALLAGISGGLRKFLLTKLLEREVPEYMTCFMALPLPNSTLLEELTNALTGATYSLPVGAASPKERFSLAERNIQERKKSVEPSMTYFFLSLFGQICFKFPALPKNYKSEMIAIGNFAGPSHNLKLNGQDLYDISSLVLSPATDLLFTFFSNANSLIFQCVGTHKVFSSQEEIAQIVALIYEEFINLETLVE